VITNIEAKQEQQYKDIQILKENKKSLVIRKNMGHQIWKFWRFNTQTKIKTNKNLKEIKAYCVL
jgi:hypothetical protein